MNLERRPRSHHQPNADVCDRAEQIPRHARCRARAINPSRQNRDNNVVACHSSKKIVVVVIPVNIVGAPMNLIQKLSCGHLFGLKGTNPPNRVLVVGERHDARRMKEPTIKERQSLERNWKLPVRTHDGYLSTCRQLREMRPRAQLAVLSCIRPLAQGG